MYAEAIATKDAQAFEHLLGTTVVSQAVLEANTDRQLYFEPARKCETHLFLDPDTGVAIGKKPKRKSASYLFADELLEIAQGRPHLLTLVFDQSVGRGSERKHLDSKLSALATRGLCGLAYVSHACFLLVGKDASLMKRATQMVREGSRLPDNRFIERAAEPAA
jgi:hypothetical protein